MIFLPIFPRVLSDFVAPIPLPFVSAVFPLPLLGVRFHHDAIAIAAMLAELELPTIYRENLPLVSALHYGTPICDLAIVYAEQSVALRLRKN